jgi:uncharacterized protein YdeI (YjbR/CyaY-like superfamily)
MPSVPGEPLPIKLFKSAAAWESWLTRYGASAAGVWLKLGKGPSAKETVSYQDALEAALCHGWIDGQKKALSESHWLQKFTPRGARSIWSRRNREKAGRLIEEGRMRPAGLQAIERARKNGRWDAAYEGQKSARPPRELLAALKKSPPARSFFASLDSRNRYAILFRVHNTRLPATRRSLIEKFVQMLEKGETLYPVRKKKGDDG